MKKLLLSLILTVSILTNSSCYTVQECKVKVRPFVVVCKDICEDTEGLYTVDGLALDGIEGKVICKF
jgi:hypothetical protein